MSNKNKREFTDTRNTLTYRPKIEFVEPRQILVDQNPKVAIEPEPNLLDRRLQTEEVIEQYKRVEELSDLAQKRIDDRARKMQVCLDPLADGDVIAALRRHFGGDVAPCITYEQYRQCLDEVARRGQEHAKNLHVTEDIINVALSNRFRTDFGGLSASNGNMLPTIQFGSPVQPIDFIKFQKDAVQNLFKMMQPLIRKLIKDLT